MQRRTASLALLGVLFVGACSASDPYRLDPTNPVACEAAARRLYDANIAAGESQASAYGRYQFSVNSICNGP